MSDEAPLHDVALPALMRAARQTYGRAIRDAVEATGCDDIPRNGAFVLGAIARSGAPLSAIIDGLGVSKQTGGALVDTLVTRGYLDRVVDPMDRRRLQVDLTERGHAAATVIRDAVDSVDDALLERVSADYIAHTRATLGALIDLAEPDHPPVSATASAAGDSAAPAARMNAR